MKISDNALMVMMGTAACVLLAALWYCLALHNIERQHRDVIQSFQLRGALTVQKGGSCMVPCASHDE